MICFMVIVALLLQNGGQTVWAWSGNPIETEADNTLEEETEEPKILHEIEENRGEFSKEYLLSDNSRTLVVYPQQIHYETEDGNLVEIDNSLIKTEEGYENGDNSYDVLITDNEDSQGEVIYKEDKYEISWQMMEFVDEEEDIKENQSIKKVKNERVKNKRVKNENNKGKRDKQKKRIS